MSDELPNSLRAEQALLGILLHDYTAIERVPALFRPEHMHDPVHQRLADAIIEISHHGGLPDPITLGERFSEDAPFQEMGGFSYLADLVDHSPPATNTGDLCLVITDLHLRRSAIRMGQELIEKATKDRATPALELLDRHERELYDLTSSREERGPRPVYDIFGEALQQAADAHQSGGELAGMSTGLSDLDKKMGGLVRGDLAIIAARPSMGKTGLGLDMAKHNAKTYRQELINGVMTTVSGGITAFFSLEMSGGQLGTRLLAQEVEISGDRIRRGQFDVNDFGRMRDAVMELRDIPLYIDDTAGISLAALTTRCRRLKRTVGLDLVVVDLLQIVSTDGDEGQAPVQRVTKITNGLKRLAKELDVAVVALSHLTRAVENRPDKRPQLSDLKESGSIEQDADQVMFIYRNSYYLEREQPKEGSAEHMKWEEELEKCRNEAEIIIGKQRHGPVGTVKVLFNGDLTKFSDTIRDEEFQPRASAA